VSLGRIPAELVDDGRAAALVPVYRASAARTGPLALRQGRKNAATACTYDLAAKWTPGHGDIY